MSQSFLPRSGEQYKKLTASAAALDPDVFENTEFGMKWAISQDLSFTVVCLIVNKQLQQEHLTVNLLR